MLFPSKHIYREKDSICKYNYSTNELNPVLVCSAFWASEWSATTCWMNILLYIIMFIILYSSVKEKKQENGKTKQESYS